MVFPACMCAFGLPPPPRTDNVNYALFTYMFCLRICSVYLYVLFTLGNKNIYIMMVILENGNTSGRILGIHRDVCWGYIGTCVGNGDTWMTILQLIGNFVSGRSVAMIFYITDRWCVCTPGWIFSMFRMVLGQTTIHRQRGDQCIPRSRAA